MADRFAAFDMDAVIDAIHEQLGVVPDDEDTDHFHFIDGSTLNVDTLEVSQGAAEEEQ